MAAGGKKRVLVDMSVTILHHGHIRLLRKASELGEVCVGLASDEEILKAKGYLPEIPFDGRREILKAIRYVSEVIPAPWLVDEAFLDKNGFDFLVHGSDNVNPVPSERLVVFERTEGVCSSELREKSAAIHAYLSSRAD